jgi:hypothetical protein
MRGVLTGHPTRPASRRSVVGMKNRAEVREFLVSRRAKITPSGRACPTSAPDACPDYAAAKSQPSPG